MAKSKTASKAAPAATMNSEPANVTTATPAKRGRPSRKDKENVVSSPVANHENVPAATGGQPSPLEDENKRLREKIAMMEGTFHLSQRQTLCNEYYC
jgi:TolA-binding protein